MVMSASLWSLGKDEAVGHNRQAPPARAARYRHADRERGLVTSVYQKRNRSRYPTEPARMKPRTNCVTEWPINAVTIVLAALLLTTGVRAHAQTTDKAST